MSGEGSQPDGASAARLVRRIESGDRAAEAELVELYSRGIGYLLRHLTGDRALADDLHQETFRAVLEAMRRGDLREPEKLTGFIRATAKNLARAERRRWLRRGSPVPVEEIELADPAAGQLSQAVRAQDRLRVRALLGELRSDRDRELLLRHYLAEESKESICARLGLEGAQFNLLLHRARQRFRELFERQEKRLRLVADLGKEK